MKVLRKCILWILLTLFLLPVVMFGFWFHRQVRQDTLDHALITAIKMRDANRAEALLNEGADANAKDTPYKPLSLRSRVVEAWDRIRCHKSSIEKEFYCSALLVRLDPQQTDDNPRLVQVLLQHGANPNQPDIHGYTPLHRACWSRLPKISQALLEQGANPNARSENGLTPLMCAFIPGWNNPCANLLFEHGANANAVDPDGKDRFDVCLECQGN